MFVTFKNATDLDPSLLEDLDIKIFDNCWDKDTWAAVINSHKVRLISSGMGAVGFWAARVYPPAVQDARTRVELVKIGLLKKFRGKGHSKAMLRDIRGWLASEFGGPNHVEAVAIVPEMLLQPDWDSFAGHWLHNMGFKPSERLFDRLPPQLLWPRLSPPHSVRLSYDHSLWR